MKLFFGSIRPGFRNLLAALPLLVPVFYINACTFIQNPPTTALNKNITTQNHDLTIAELKKDIKHRPNDSEAWYLLGNAYYEQRKFAQATHSFEKAITLRLPEDKTKNAYDRLAWSYYKMGRYNRAIAVFEKALKLFPGWPAPSIGKASSLRQKGQYNEALSEFNRILETDPHNLVALNNRGWTYYMIMNYTRALKDFQEVQDLSRGRPALRANVLNGQGWCYYMKGDFGAALMKFEQAATTAPPSYSYGLWDAYRGMAFSKAALGNFDSSYSFIGKAKSAMTYNPNHDLALLHYAAGDKEGTWHYLGGPGYIGISLQVVSMEGIDILYVAKVDRNGPAERAGILPGDIILSVEGQPAVDLECFARVVKSAKPGTRISLVVSRRGVDREVSIIIEDASRLILNDPLLTPILQD